MEQQPFKTGMLEDALFDFTQGQNNGIAQLLLPKNQLAKATNATVRGDFAVTRPPFNQLALTFDGGLATIIQTGLFQCAAFYKDDYGNPYLAAAISGRLFLFTPEGSGFHVTEITIAGDPNPAALPQAWLWQAEKWLIWNDGQSIPVVFDGNSSRRTTQGSAVLGTTVAPAKAIPAINALVTVTLAAPYTGLFNVLVALYNNDVVGPPPGVFLGYFQTVGVNNTTESYQVTLTNISGANQTVVTGDTVTYPATGGTTIQLGALTANVTLSVGGGCKTLSFVAPIPSNIVGNLSFLVSQGGNPLSVCTGSAVIGQTSVSVRLTSGGPVTLLASSVINTTGATPTDPKPPYPVGLVTLGPYTFTPGQVRTVTLDTPYSGPDGVTVTINGIPYTIAKAGVVAPTTSLTLINITGKPDTGTTTSIIVGSEVRSVPELPPGRMGTYGLGRNWLSLTSGRAFVASDLVGGSSGTPAELGRDAVLRFQENAYLAGGGAFPVPSDAGEITAMRFISNLDTSLGQGPLMVHTADLIFSCQAPIDRTKWQDVVNPILTEAYKPHGGLSQESTKNVSSDSLFRTLIGIQSLILGRRDFDVWGNVPISEEVDPTLQADQQQLLRFASAIEFDNRYLITAGPAQGPNGVYHSTIIALNYSPLSSLRGKQPAVYDGNWTGMPGVLQLVTGRFSGVDRAFAFVFNPELSINELWEILPTVTTQSDDNGTDRIVLDIESPILDFDQKDPRNRSFLRLEDGEIYVQGIVGRVDFETFYRPDFDPNWHPWHSWCVQDTPSWQTRMGLGEPPKVNDNDTGRLTRDGYIFQFRVKMTGRGRFMGARFQSSKQPQPKFAKPMICIETPEPDDAQNHPPTASGIVAPTAWWNFQEIQPSGGQSKYLDISGHDNYLEFSTGAYALVTGKIDNGTDQGSGTLALNRNLTQFAHTSGNGLSHAFWVKMLTCNVFNVGPFVSIRYGAQDYGIRLQNGGSGGSGSNYPLNEVVLFGTSGIPASSISAPFIVPADWFHVAFTMSSSGDCILYVNATVVKTGNVGTIPAAGTGQYLVQQQFAGSTYSMDEMGFWANSVLSPSDVLFLYNNGTGRTFPFT